MGRDATREEGLLNAALLLESKPGESRSHALLRNLEALRQCFNKAIDGGDSVIAASAFSRALFVWNMLAIEVAGWITTATLEMESEAEAVDSQKRLKHLLLVQIKGGLPEYEKLDPAAPILPRALAEQLFEACCAAEKGETSELFSVKRGGRHGAGRTHSYDEARMRAVEWLEYLVGKGVDNQSAAGRVAAAIQTVSAKTILDWRARELPKHIWNFESRVATARGAGKLDAQLEDDPDFGRRESESFNYPELVLRDELKAESLAQFGKRYRREFARLGQNGVRSCT